MPESPPPLRQQDLEQAATRVLLAAALQRKLVLVPLTILLLLVLGALQFSADDWLGPHGSEQVLLAGAQMPIRVLRGEWWRLFTAPWLHGDWSHLMLNALSLFVVGRPVEATYGPARFWIIFSGAALAGTLASLGQGAPMSVGASGAVFGMLGAMLGLGLKLLPRLSSELRWTLVLVPAGLLVGTLVLGLLLDATPGAIDHHAHWGGGFGGLCLGLVLQPRLDLGEAVAVRGPAVIRAVAWTSACVVGLALALASQRIGTPIELPPVARATFRFDALAVPYPRDARRGVLRGGRCDGTQVDPAWALRTGRVTCFVLPLGAILELGRRADLLTLDDKDFAVLRRANDSGAFVQRQPNVMLFPLGTDLLYALIAPEPLLASHADALRGMLPGRGQAYVGVPSAALRQLDAAGPPWLRWQAENDG
ncbi:MAG: rhomboid family intramembrane serine protease [Myxococcales bacterium]|nr:rhomboid family intramembrane serine protease [Myxococcales bacterium]